MPAAQIFGCSGPALTPDEAAFFRDADPWGYILFARNLETPDQIRRLTDALRDAIARDAPILIDQEGGRVARLTPPGWTGWDDALPYLSALPTDLRAEAMALRSRVIAAELRRLGIDVNCAPVADVARDDTHDILRDRCYSREPQEVSIIGRAVADGLLAGGVLPVLKHIPGHGRGTADSHLDLPVIDADLDDLDETDFRPFRDLADLPLGMTGHLLFPALDPDQPSTLSPAVIAHIRDALGFKGLLMTDDVSMAALPGPLAERASRARAAGCDLILHCNADMGEMEAIASETPTLTGDAAARSDTALALRGQGMGEDPADGLAELAKLTGRHA